MKTRRFLAVLLTMVMAISILPTFTLTASAADCTTHTINSDGICTTCYNYGTCGDNLTWTLDSNGLLTISGTGEMTKNPWKKNSIYGTGIKEAVIEDGVTSICKSAFDNCQALAKVTVKGDLDLVETAAFNMCANGLTITFKGNVKTFQTKVYYRKEYSLTIVYEGSAVPEYTSPFASGSSSSRYPLTINVTPEYYLNSTTFCGISLTAPKVALNVTSNGNGTAVARASYTSTTDLTAISVKSKAYLIATPNEGYYLKGYEVVSGGVEISEQKTFIAGAKDIEIKAVFEAIPDTAKTISFDSNSADSTGIMDMIVVAEGETAKALPENLFTRTHYIFNGWNTSADGNGTSYAADSTVSYDNITKNTTFYAQWIPKTFNITYDANGGTGTMQATTVNSSSTVNYTFPECEFTPPKGKIFAGWTMGGPTSSSIYQPGTTRRITIDYVLYAQWEEPAVDITIDGTTKQYPNLRLAAAAVSGVENATIKVLRDIVTDNNTTSYPSFEAKNLIFDLNNYTIKLEPYQQTTNFCLFLSNNVSIKGPGTITRESTVLSLNSNAVVTIGEGVVISNTSTSANAGAVNVASGATLILNGATIITKSTSPQNCDINGTSGDVFVNADNVANIFNNRNVYFSVTPSTEPKNNYSSGKFWYKIDNKLENVTVSAAEGEIAVYNGITYAVVGATVTVTPNEGTTLSNCYFNTTAATATGDGSFTFAMPSAVAEITDTKKASVFLADNTVKAILPSGAETAVLIVASYNSEKMVDVKRLTISADTEMALGTDGMGLTYSSGNTVKAFLWSDMVSLTPLCDGVSTTITE